MFNLFIFLFKMEVIYGKGRQFADGADMLRSGLDAFHADDRVQRGMQQSDEKCLIIS